MSRHEAPWRRGDRITADRLAGGADAQRSNHQAGPPGAIVSRGRFGTFVTERLAPPNGNALGVITTTITARSGTSPTFTYGVGEALILRDDGTGTATTGVTRTVYNTLNVAIAAGPGLVQFKTIYGKLFADVADCEEA